MIQTIYNMYVMHSRSALDLINVRRHTHTQRRARAHMQSKDVFMCRSADLI